VLTSQTITLAGYAFPSLAAYRTLFAICAAAALAGAVIAMVIGDDDRPKLGEPERSRGPTRTATAPSASR
jgi:hypothetical protein